MGEIQSQVLLEVGEEVAKLRLGDPQEKAIILNAERMKSLKVALEGLRSNSKVTALIIFGGNPAMFCAGADINAIKGVTDKATGEALAKDGQEIFDLLAALPQKKYAAISGPCVGGGCELVLACDHRIMFDHPSSRIGLPEVKLGILPGFGGTQRLPRLVGLPSALDVILKGKVLPAKEAAKIGLVDIVVSASDLGGAANEAELFEKFQDYVTEIALGKRQFKPKSKLSAGEKFLSFNMFGRAIVRSKTESALQKESKGRYPAPIKALQSVLYGLQNGMKDGLVEERKLLGELIISSESKALVHLFQISEEAQKLGRTFKNDSKDLTVTVVGGGTMGAGIASASLLSGLITEVVEPIEAVRKRAGSHVQGALERKRSLNEEKRRELEKKFRLVADQLEITPGKIVIEAIVEDPQAKKQLYQALEPRLPAGGILATNTSSLPLGIIGDQLADPGRFVGLHFFNPADRMPLIEVIRAEQTKDETVLRAAAFAARLGKYPIVVEDVPGFLVNRILTPYLVEASILLAEGFSIQEIDNAAEQFGMPMGPLRLLDEIGLDVAAKVSDVMEEAYGERMRGHNFAGILAKKGLLGRKSGQGFYRHSEKGAMPVSSIRIDLGLDVGEKRTGFTVGERLILALVGEAIRCLDEGVAGLPGPEAAGQIDLGTVMGIGFPPYRGGVIWYADSVGAKTLAQKLGFMSEALGSRFAPSPGLKKRAEGNESFFTSVIRS